MRPSKMSSLFAEGDMYLFRAFPGETHDKAGINKVEAGPSRGPPLFLFAAL
jgi:hypothetical protein